MTGWLKQDRRLAWSHPGHRWGDWKCM